MRYIDLTQPFTNAMPVYPGDPVPELTQVASLETHGHTDFHLSTRMHVGTHLDAPLHMLPGGKRLMDFPLQTFFGRGALINAVGRAVIDESVLAGVRLERGDIVLILTGWSKKFGSPDYYHHYPVVTEPLANALVGASIAMVGLDFPSPDQPPFTVHKILLGHDVLILENLTNLEALQVSHEFNVVALPAKLEADSAPVRVVAQVE